MVYESQQDAFCSALLTNVDTETIQIPSDKKSSDRLLWGSFKSGDELAFTKIYKDYSTQLFEYGCRYSTDQEMIKDCLHDFFIYLRKNRLGFSDTHSIKPYLFKAFRRRVVEYLKKSNRQLNMEDPTGISLVNVESSTEAIYINKQVHAEQAERLAKALSTLDNKGRRAIYYFYFKGHSYEQVAELLKFTHVSSARRVMYRSLKQLRLFLATPNLSKF